MSLNFKWLNWLYNQGVSVARIAREHDINDNLLFKWLRLSLIKGRISRRLPVTNSSGIGVELLPVEMTLDERPYPVFYAR
ncbi:Putative transposase [Escherichia coli]|uniref:Transposase n=1 Tax=Escherichia coli TaxID=562 RepID=A0A376Y485_ECOLX|nr:Putative transposase [Escherichia coli]